MHVRSKRACPMDRRDNEQVLVCLEHMRPSPLFPPTQSATNSIPAEASPAPSAHMRTASFPLQPMDSSSGSPTGMLIICLL